VVHGRIDDGALIIKEVNAAFENTFGFEAADLQGQDLNQILVPDGQREEAATLDREALRHGHAEKVVQRQTAGGLRDFQLQLTRAQTGDTREVYAVYTDITRQREQKRKLEQMQEEMELALDHTDSIIFGIGSENQSVGPEDRSVWRRGSFSHFFDASSAEVPTVDAFADHAVHPEDQEKFRRFYHEVVEGGREFGQLEYRTHPQLGDVWWIRDHVHAKDESQRHQVLGLARNVTAQKQREEELRESKEEAEEARQLKSAMLANMSHEIRTPLTSITGFSQILQETLDGKREEFAGKIHQSSQRLMDTIETVLQLSKLEAGVKSLRGEVVALREVVETVEELVRPWVEGESLTLHVETPECPVEGYWSEDAVRRITRNLVENAIKFTQEGGRVEISATKENGEAVLEVEDTGIGISEDAIPEVFHAFKQESEGRDREYEGTGLGLSIVNRLTNELGGDIEVDTEKGEGTCFAVHLPLSPPEKSPTAA
jgi:PAS domain S-box-containing protein